MRNLFLCGHTGSQNRGCEAIVKSSVELFTEAGFHQKPYLATFAPEQDKQFGLDENCALIEYGKYSSVLERVLSGIMRKLRGNPLIGQSTIQKELWTKIQQGDLSLAIGGDTYCYGAPTVFIAHNHKMSEEGVPSVLWCCSLEKDKLTGQTLKDIKKYDLIVARETTTYKSLIDAGVSKERIFLCCDPAFTLKEKETQLPAGFEEGNTVGINISSLVLNDKTQRAVEYLVRHIIEKTAFHICLVPHVYTAQPVTGDMELLKNIYDKYSASGRLSIVDAELNCQELKYIIGRTRFFIGARTHSTIAAYSSGVPTLVLGYSVKSLGIARDLFGTEEGYVLSYNDIETDEAIAEAFEKIVRNEKQIKEHYEKTLPEYTASVKEVTKTVLERYLGN